MPACTAAAATCVLPLTVHVTVYVPGDSDIVYVPVHSLAPVGDSLIVAVLPLIASAALPGFVVL